MWGSLVVTCAHLTGASQAVPPRRCATTNKKDRTQRQNHNQNNLRKIVLKEQRSVGDQHLLRRRPRRFPLCKTNTVPTKPLKNMQVYKDKVHQAPRRQCLPLVLGPWLDEQAVLPAEKATAPDIHHTSPAVLTGGSYYSSLPSSQVLLSTPTRNSKHTQASKSTPLFVRPAPGGLLLLLLRKKVAKRLVRKAGTPAAHNSSKIYTRPLLCPYR